ncbi:MAG: DUF1566 domain-containing protein, partial [Desulfobacterales bacterium]|nr:DUF1566 domain-containing protein [Desulfobacterales bacterium]
GAAPAADDTNGAATGDVLSGRTFWGLTSGQWGQQTGGMPNNGAFALSCGAGDQGVTAGYYSGTLAGDGDLVSANIRSGVNIFGVAGDSNVVNTSTGDAVAGEILTGKIGWANGSPVTGTMADNGAFGLSCGAGDQGVTAGYYSGGTLAGDADLVSTNIKSSVTVFGVTGTVIESSGDAAAGDVFTGKTFSNAGAAGVSGTMADNGAVSITPGTSAQTIAAGYHNGSGTVAGDADLAVGNIKSGVDIFGVTGTVIESSGDAAAGDVLTGKTFSNAGAAGVSGTMADNGAVSMTPGTSAQTVTAGYHNGSGTVAGDADLAVGNIKSGVDIFGVTGTATAAAYPALVPKTGQTTSYRTEDDGNIQKGVAWPARFTNNGDGTVTDNLTGLMWIQNPDETLRNWDAAISYCNALTTAGYTDWHLSNQMELISLIDISQYNPALPAGHPFSGLRADTYWSGSTSADDTSSARSVNLYNGAMGSATKTGTFYVLPVRGGQ